MSEGQLIRKKELYEWQELDFSKVMFNTVAPFPYRRSIIMVSLDDLDVSHVDLQKMMEGGMNILRLGPHRSSSQVSEVIGKLKKASKFLAEKHGRNAWPYATCMEILSRNVTTGLLENTKVNSILIEENTEIILSLDQADYCKCNERRIYVNNPYLVMDATIGLEISISEDNIILQVTEINKKTVKCIVTKQGHLFNLAMVFIKLAKRSRPFVTKEDLEYVKVALENQMDMIVVNYVRHPYTVKKIKQYIGKQIKKPWIASGICTMEGLTNIDDVIMESDVILFSREILAYELDKKYFSRMVRIQKYVVGKCRKAGKPIFLCGQVFQSMLKTGFLAYGDVSDVANAILDGISGIGIKACKNIDDLKLTMHRLSELCKQMEPFTCNTKTFKQSIEGMNVPLNAALSSAMSCVLLANKSQAHAIIVPTVSGRTIYYVNQYHSICPIIAVTTNIEVFNSLEMNRSVTPIFFQGPPQENWSLTVHSRLEYAVEYGLNKGWLNYGDDYVTLEKGLEESTFCDTIRIHRVALKKTQNIECPEAEDPGDA